MSEVGLTDLSKLLHTKRDYNKYVMPSCDRANFFASIDIIFGVLTRRSAIVASRKRKLRELFAVATGADGQAHDGFTNPDAPPTTQAEGHFLQANEIFQYVGAID